MTNHGNSFITFGQDLDMGDLEFIRGKTLSGDWIHVTGNIDALNDDLVYVPANGKTFFLYSAKVVMINNPVPSAVGNSNQTLHEQIVAALKIDGTIEDKAKLGAVSHTQSSAPSDYGNGTAYNYGGQARFDASGLSLEGDGVKEVAIENILDNGSADATLAGWIEDT